QHVSEIKQQGKPTQEQIEKGKDLKKNLQEVEPNLKQVEETFKNLMLQVPNPAAIDVPVGKDETENQVIKTHGEVPDFKFQPLDHQELMENLDLLDTQRATKIGGFRSYFLKNDAVILEQAVLN